jgi:hypothetical protein
MLQNLILHNPLEDEFPNDPVDRIHRLARDLAWGALNNLWSSRVEIRNGKFVSARGIASGMLGDYLAAWGDALPSANLLIAFKYMVEQQTKSASGVVLTVGDLTLEAFALLKKPVRSPEVYISYNREQSSALALLTAARLQMVGVPNPFLDMNQNPGDTLHAEQEGRVRGSDFLVCLFAPDTLNSHYVRLELQWALETDGVNLIPIWHNGFSPSHDYPQGLAVRNAIRVHEESAEAYNTAMVRLLNRVGFAP